jgi:hypothetical protein
VPKPTTKLPKVKCCVDKPRCKRCPLRMLADGTLPEGLTVKKRRLVTADVHVPVRKLKKGKKGRKGKPYGLPKAA